MFRNKEVKRLYNLLNAKLRGSNLYGNNIFWEIIDEELRLLDSSLEEDEIGFRIKVSHEEQQVRISFSYISPIGKYNPQDLNTKMKKEYLWRFKLGNNGELICKKDVGSFQMYDSFYPVKSVLNTNRVYFEVASCQTVYDSKGLKLLEHHYDDKSAFICLAGEHRDYLDLNNSNLLETVDLSYVKDGPTHTRFRFIPSFVFDDLEENDIKKEIILGAYVPTHRSHPKISLVKTHKTNPNIRYVRTCKLEETGWKETIEIREGGNTLAYFNGEKWIPCEIENTANLDEIVKVFSL